MNTLDETAAAIESLVDEWRPKLLSVEEDAAHHKPAPERWSISEVVGHLIDSACNNHQRFVRAQHADALTFPKYEQNEWVTDANYQHGDWASLIELWYHYNRLIAVLIRHIPSSSLATSCVITPLEPCTLEFLVTDYLVHLRHHLTKLAARIDVR